jgi:hypothetical protein
MRGCQATPEGKALIHADTKKGSHMHLFGVVRLSLRTLLICPMADYQ